MQEMGVVAFGAAHIPHGGQNKRPGWKLRNPGVKDRARGSQARSPSPIPPSAFDDQRLDTARDIWYNCRQIR